MVSAIGLGGHHVGQMSNQREAIRLVHAAIDAGITFMDNAWEYHDGRSEVVMGKAIADRRDRVFLMPVATTVSGIDSMRVLRQNLRVAKGFKPMSKRQMDALRTRVREEAADGRYELYKTTAGSEGKVGRKQHGFPSEEEQAARRAG